MIARLIASALFVLTLFLGSCGGGSSSSSNTGDTESTASETSPVKDSGNETSDGEATEDETSEALVSCIDEEESVNYTDEYCAPDGEKGRTMYVYTDEMLEGYSGVTGRLVMTVTGMGGQTESEGQYFIWINGKDGDDTHVISALYHKQPETTLLRHTPWVNDGSRFEEFNSRAEYDYLVDKEYTFVMAWDSATVTLKVYEGDTNVMYQELPLSRPFSHVYEVRVGSHAHNIANLGTSFNIRKMRLTFYE